MAVWRHLYDPVTDTHYTNGGFIPVDTEVPTVGFQWLEGRPPAGTAVFQVKPLAEKLREIFDAQTVALKVQFAPLKAAVHLELAQGNVDVARGIIETADIAPELESIRQALLALFPPV